MYGAGHYDVKDNVEVYSRGLFSKNTVQTIIAPSGVFGSSVVVPFSNPYLPVGIRNQFCAVTDGDPVTAGLQPLTAAQCAAAAAAKSPTDPNFRTFTTTLSRRTPEVGPRVSSYTTTIFDYRGGVKVGITEGLNLDVSGGYGESENIQTLQGYVLTSRVRSAVYATNTTTCLGNASGGASITAGTGCVPLNIFGDLGSITSGQVPYITGESTTAIRTSLAQARALLSGDFGFASPFASDSIGFAAGGEYRKYRASQRSDTLAQTAGELGGAGGAAPNIDGGYEVTEGFGEIIAPLVQDKRFFESLTLEAGVRYSHYKVFAPTDPTYNTTTYKAGGSWEPAIGLKFRGNYQRAVRAPNISELFSPVNTGLTNLSTDPCASIQDSNNAVIAPAPTGTLRDVCLAQGAPASTLGSIRTPTAGQAAATAGGNLNLSPEKSDSYTAGVVIQPTHIVPGLSITADYYYIKVDGAITQPGPADAVNACFGAGNLSATNPACLSIRRNPVTGNLAGDPATTAGLFLALSNLGTLKTDGIDLGINYRRDLGFAKLALAFQGNWTNRSQFQSAPGAINRECTGYYSVNCASIQPEFFWNTRATFTFTDDIDVSALWRHIDGVIEEPLDNPQAFSGTFNGQQVDFTRIPAYNYIDLAARFRASDNFDFGITVTNLFDKKPPIVGSTIGSTSYNSGNTYPSTYDSLGRRYAFSARVHF